MKKLISKLIASTFPDVWKKYAELAYWKKQKSQEGTLSNTHYSFFYTSHFDLKNSFYKGKKILDIGCGPRGSLEWAKMAERRIGLDPLANSYLKIGANKHQMDYVNSPSESMPFDEEYFDVVCSFNSLDHVSNVDKSISEIKRVTKPGGLFLFLVEVNHEPTNCEPHRISPKIVTNFAPEFECLELKIFKPLKSGLYNSIKDGERYPNPRSVTEVGWLSAKLKKQVSV